MNTKLPDQRGGVRVARDEPDKASARASATEEAGNEFPHADRATIQQQR